jgi:hypothetical protein
LYSKTAKWEKHDFGQAMVNAVYRHAPHKYIRHIGDKLTFNGFWRDGQKRNVCIWPEEAAWSDLHQNSVGSSKGGVTSFAKTVLNLELNDFMQQYGNSTAKPAGVKKQSSENFSADYINGIWATLIKRNENRTEHVDHWLTKARNLPEPHRFIGYRFWVYQYYQQRPRAI